MIRTKMLIKCIAATVFLAILLIPASAQGQSSDNVSHFMLPNGLEIFAVEDHSVPLVTICMAFRGGASAQTPETAGLFHLYEHMLFAGNEKFPTKEAFAAALNNMGTTMWNGATGAEFINYHITIPSKRLEEGMDFWAQAVRNPLFNPATLENEKQVVLNEIRGYHSDPARIANNALESRMFADSPWRKNVDGPESNIESATVDKLKSMQASFYIPSNMALLIGGDCAPEEVFTLAHKLFGDWNGALAPLLGEPPHGPIPEGIKLVAAEDLFYRGLAQVQYRWRGPDVLLQTKDTYSSDVLLYLLSSPVGHFKTSIMSKVEGLYDAEYIDFSYPTARDGGNFIFTTFMVIQDPAGEGAILDRTENLRAALLDEFALIAKNPEAYFGAEELEKAKIKLIDLNIYAMENAQSFITDTLTFWWSTATAEYYFAYEKNCGEVSWADIANLTTRYIVGEEKAPEAATLMRIRTSTLETDRNLDEKMLEHGYEKVNADNAFWWQK
ncbi:MAG TPA: pitrilysin family protein [Rectinemataceae bacterium]|nr:pitrilysin family protein [Rectinemataceae bacterium]